MLVFKSRVLVKYFLSYFVLLVAIFGILAFVFENVFSFMRSEVESTVMKQFEQIGFVFEGEMESLKTTADLIHTNEYLTRFRLSNSDYMAFNGIKELKKLRASNSFIHDVFISYQDGYVYSARGKASIDVYARDILFLDGESADKIHSILMKQDKRGIYSLYYENPSHSQPAYMLCTYPITDINSVATVSFVISSHTIRKMINNLLTDSGSSARMSLPSGEFFTEIPLLEGKDSPFAANYGGKYFYYSYKTDESGFEFNMAIDSAGVLGPVRELQKRSYLLILATFILALLLSYLFSRRHYKPIKQLNKRAIEHTGRNVLIDAGNEFDAILKVMDYEGLENRKLSQKLDEIGFILRQQSFELLFSGMIRDEERQAELMAMGEIEVKGTFTVLVVIQTCGNGEKQDMHLVAGILSTIFGAYYITRIMDTEAAVFVVGLGEDHDPAKSQRKRAAREAQSRFAGHPSMHLAFCFGRVSRDLSSISRIYAEALICAEQSLLYSEKYARKGDDENILFFENLSSNRDEGYHLDQGDLDALFKSLEAKNLNESMAGFELIMKKLHEKNLSPKALEFYYYDLLYRTFHRFSFEGMERQVLNMLESGLGSTEKFTGRMKDLFKSIIREMSSDTGNEIILKIVEYIDNNFKNSNLSLAFLAEKYQISPNYISKYFKEKTGESYINYVSEMRMKEAYRLVLESDLPIHEISMNVGYLDAVNFTKKFKKIYNMTPTELRQKHRKVTE